eukprot:jgi/Mesvir1/29201/Mv08095-RA.1
MFYSADLLAKKSPLGKLWIAATLKSNKLNRKNVASVNLVKTAEMLKEPPVPLALRLSGILMGGLVVVFKEQMRYLHEDASAFLVKISSAIIQRHDASLLQGAGHGKVANVTLNISYDLIGNQPLRPAVQDEDVFVVRGQHYVLGSQSSQGPTGLLPSAEKSAKRRKHSAKEDITLVEADTRGGLLEADFLLGGEQQEQFLGPEMPDMPEMGLPPMEEFPELPPLDDLPPRAAAGAPPGLTTIPETLEENVLLVEEPAAAPGRELSPVRGADTAGQPPYRGGGGARRGGRRVLLDEAVEISAETFGAWLQDTSDIVRARRVAPVPKPKPVDAGDVHLLPSCAAMDDGGTRRELYRTLVQRRAGQMAGAPAAGAGASPADERGMGRGREMPDFPPMEDYQDGGLPPMDEPVPGREGVTVTPGLEPEVFRAGGVGSASPGRLTPHPSAGDLAGRAGKRKASGSLSDAEGRPLRLDFEGPLSGDRAQRGAHPSLSPGGKIPTDLFDQDLPAAADALPEIPETAGAGAPPGTLSQFELFEETGPGATQRTAGLPENSIDKHTQAMISFLREAFVRRPDEDGVVREGTQQPPASLLSMAAGLSKNRASRVFYQICVLASTRYVTASKDILNERGHGGVSTGYRLADLIYADHPHRAPRAHSDLAGSPVDLSLEARAGGGVGD